ncbi:MAG TPA: hypothetical protein VF955_04150 [Pyrinomonadaceae bacterium]
MFKTNKRNKNELDRAGRIVLFAASRNDEEAEAAAASPFLFARVRAAISEAEQQGEAAGWLPLLFVARRAVPAMALIAILTAILTVWSIRPFAPAPGYGLEDEALSDTHDPGVEQTILTRNTLSRDEVFSLVVDRNEREKR